MAKIFALAIYTSLSACAPTRKGFSDTGRRADRVKKRAKTRAGLNRR